MPSANCAELALWPQSSNHTWTNGKSSVITFVLRLAGNLGILIALVAQLDRALPSEGRGQRFESSRVRHFTSCYQ